MTKAEQELIDALLAEPFAFTGTSDTRRGFAERVDAIRVERMPPEAHRTLVDLSERAAFAEKARIDFAVKIRAPESLVERVKRAAIDKAWDVKE